MADAILSGAEERPAVLNRKDAAALGLKHFYTGAPCKYGHHELRFVSSSECVVCCRDRQSDKRHGIPRPPRVLLTEEEKKRRKAESDKRYREEHKPTPEQLAKRAEKNRRWRERNPERARELSRKYYMQDPGKYRALAKADRLRNPEKFHERFKNWASKNKAHLKEYRAARYQANKAEDLANSKIWKAANVERIKEWMRRYRAENPQFAVIHQQNRRARKLRNGGKLSKGLAQKLLVLQRHKCACCRANLRLVGYQLDHIEPLALGGRNDDQNMQLLCPPCNRSKHAKPPHEFMQSRGYLL
jgi:5-methylcytosine-specific restriction endonuclease McrA